MGSGMTPLYEVTVLQERRDILGRKLPKEGCLGCRTVAANTEDHARASVNQSLLSTEEIVGIRRYEKNGRRNGWWTGSDGA